MHCSEVKKAFNLITFQIKSPSPWFFHFPVQTKCINSKVISDIPNFVKHFSTAFLLLFLPSCLLFFTFKAIREFEAIFIFLMANRSLQCSNAAEWQTCKYLSCTSNFQCSCYYSYISCLVFKNMCVKPKRKEKNQNNQNPPPQHLSPQAKRGGPLFSFLCIAFYCCLTLDWTSSTSTGS